MTRICTCLGTCRGAAGLGPGWTCALEITNSTASTSTADTLSLDEMVAMTKKATEARDRNEIEMFKAILQLGIAIVPTEHIAGRTMILSVPQLKADKVQRAIGELKAEQAKSADGNPLASR